jgi:N-acyl-L-homoserine lactone synthetase
MQEIAKYCADEPEYIRNNMPIQEIIFRVILLRNNKPTLLEELHTELTEKWANPTRPINISLDGLNRILSSDNYYGFSRS